MNRTEESNFKTEYLEPPQTENFEDSISGDVFVSEVQTQVNTMSSSANSTQTEQNFKTQTSPAHEVPMWTTLPLTQILVPVLCTAVVALVLTILACCLTRKKSRSQARPSERSLYSMDTSDQTSECGIYDVIDELIASQLKKAPTGPRQQPPLSRLFNFADGSLRNQGSLFTISGKPSLTCQTGKPGAVGSAACNLNKQPSSVAPRFYLGDGLTNSAISRDRTATGHSADGEHELDAREDGDCHDDDGDYETLDRYWKLKTEWQEHIASDANTLSSSSVHSDLNNHSRHRFSETSDDVSVTGEAISEETGQAQYYTPAPWAQFPQPETSENIQTTDRLLCQLTVFHTSQDGSSVPHTSDFYYLNGFPQNMSRISAMLHHSKLVVIPQTKGFTPQAITTTLSLEPVPENVLKHVAQVSPAPNPACPQLPSLSHRAPALRKTNSCKASLTNRSQSGFEDSSSLTRRESQSARRQGGEAMTTPGIHHSNMRRNSSKLGPLPPLPGCGYFVSPTGVEPSHFVSPTGVEPSHFVTPTGAEPSLSSDRSLLGGAGNTHGSVLKDKNTAAPDEGESHPIKTHSHSGPGSAVQCACKCSGEGSGFCCKHFPYDSSQYRPKSYIDNKPRNTCFDIYSRRNFPAYCGNLGDVNSSVNKNQTSSQHSSSLDAAQVTCSCDDEHGCCCVSRDSDGNIYFELEDYAFLSDGCEEG